MKYNVGDRVAFMTRRWSFAGSELTHEVGYIKQVRKGIFGVRYVICIAKSAEVWIVRERNIFGKVDRKERMEEERKGESRESYNNKRKEDDAK